VKRLLLLVALAVALIGAPAARAAGPLVELLSTSTTVTQADLQAALPAFQQHVDAELGPAWGVAATLFVGDATRPQRADMTLTVTDRPCGFGCGGFHDSHGGHPFAIAVTDPGTPWTLVAAHELDEMLVDPYINRFARWHKRTILVEVGDPVESGYYAHQIDGYWMTDFVLPSWYGQGFAGKSGRGGPRAPFDFAGALDHAGQLGLKGYVSWLDPLGVWQSAENDF
jgi:hypothetical protein